MLKGDCPSSSGRFYITHCLTDTNNVSWRPVFYELIHQSCWCPVQVCAYVCVSLPLTSIILIKGVHAGEVDSEGLKGRWQANAALRPLHVEARRRARVGRLGQARLGIFHAEYGSRRLGWLSAAPHGRSTSLQKEQSNESPKALTPTSIGAESYLHWLVAQVDMKESFCCSSFSVCEIKVPWCKNIIEIWNVERYTFQGYSLLIR